LIINGYILEVNNKMEDAHGVCKECGEDFFTDSENCGTDESLCEECFKLLQEYNKPLDSDGKKPPQAS